MTFVFLLLSLAALAFSLRAYYKLAIKVLELEVQIEESLDIIDGCYSRISATSSNPVTSDDPVIVAIVKDVTTCRDSLLMIANKLVKFSNEEEK